MSSTRLRGATAIAPVVPLADGRRMRGNILRKRREGAQVPHLEFAAFLPVSARLDLSRN